MDRTGSTVMLLGIVRIYRPRHGTKVAVFHQSIRETAHWRSKNGPFVVS
jgi:hypothetical protein